MVKREYSCNLCHTTFSHEAAEIKLIGILLILPDGRMEKHPREAENHICRECSYAVRDILNQREATAKSAVSETTVGHRRPPAQYNAL
jgi:hypothetical protein